MAARAEPAVVSVAPDPAMLSTPLRVTVSGYAPGDRAALALRLRLDGHRFDDAVPEWTGPAVLSFPLARLRADHEGWLALVGSPPPGGVKRVDVALTLPTGDLPTVGGTPLGIQLRLFTWPLLVLAVLGAGIVVGAVVVLGWRTDMLRDGAVVPEGCRRPYSLARCQMAWWFMLVTASFIGIALLTFDINHIVTPQSLTLLGISGATALAGTAIDSHKGRDPPAAPVVHESFLRDLLTDGNGWAFHRLQVAVWSVILGVATVWSAYTRLALPDFDPNLMVLLGISSGLYLGFKWPEAT